MFNKYSKEGWSFFLIVGLYALIMLTVVFHPKHQLLKDGIAGKASVISKWTESGKNGRTEYILELGIKTDTNQSTYITKSIKCNKSQWMSVSSGSIVDVFYSQSNHKNFKFGKTPPESLANNKGFLGVFGLAIIMIIIGVALFFYGTRYPDPPPIKLMPKKPGGLDRHPSALDVKPLIIAVPNIESKYHLELAKLIAFALIFGIGGLILISPIYKLFINDTTFINHIRLPLGFIGMLLGVRMGVFQTKRTSLEHKLYQPSKGKELIITNHGLQISIALLDFSWPRKLRESKQTYLNISWDRIIKFNVLPPNSVEKEAPPYYKIKISFEEDWIYVLRRDLKRREKEILERCQNHLRCPIILEDKVA